jgi:glutaredoxin-related protein
MAHFAKLGANSKVIQVLTMDNDNMKNADGIEDEAVGQQWLETHNNWPAQMWIQTSYNTSSNKHYTVTTNSEGEQTRSESADQSKALRGNYAGIGYEWDEDNQIFWPKKPYASWVKDTVTAQWKSPIGDAPALTAEQQSQNDADTHMWYYKWNEDNQSWDLTDDKA